MTKINTAVRSNVFVRSNQPLALDIAFLAQVRGHKAISLLLSSLMPGQDAQVAARKLLTARQLSEVAWQVRCVCGAFPEGPVTTATGVEIKFRCPRGSCVPSNFRPRMVYLQRSLVHDVVSAFGKTLSEIVERALALGELPTRSSALGERSPFPVRLTLSQNVMVTDEQIELALFALLERES
jgi:hypothetical protein